MIRGGFRRRIRAVRRVRRGFGKRCILRAERAIHLVGRHVQKAEPRLLVRGQLRPVGTHRFQQIEGADHIGLDELGWGVDGAVDVAFRREIDHRAGAVCVQQRVDRRAVADVAPHKNMPCIPLQWPQVVQIARVSQFVEIDDGLIARRQPVQDEIGADEPRAAGDQNHDELRVGRFGRRHSQLAGPARNRWHTQACRWRAVF